MMKRGLYKISYMVVLMAMVLLMGTRFIPHHHCASSDNGTAHAVHFGYDECDSCDNCCHQHSHDCDHSHSEQQCCNDFQFYLRIYDDDNSFVNNIFNPQPSIALSDIYIFIQPQINEQWFCDDINPPQIRTASSHALRAPPVA